MFPVHFPEMEFGCSMIMTICLTVQSFVAACAMVHLLSLDFYFDYGVNVLPVSMSKQALGLFSQRIFALLLPCFNQVTFHVPRGRMSQTKNRSEP